MAEFKVKVWHETASCGLWSLGRKKFSPLLCRRKQVANSSLPRWFHFIQVSVKTTAESFANFCRSLNVAWSFVFLSCTRFWSLYFCGTLHCMTLPKVILAALLSFSIPHHPLCLPQNRFLLTNLLNLAATVSPAILSEFYGLFAPTICNATLFIVVAKQWHVINPQGNS